MKMSVILSKTMRHTICATTIKQEFYDVIFSRFSNTNESLNIYKKFQDPSLHIFRSGFQNLMQVLFLCEECSLSSDPGKIIKMNVIFCKNDETSNVWKNDRRRVLRCDLFMFLAH